MAKSIENNNQTPEQHQENGCIMQMKPNHFIRKLFTISNYGTWGQILCMLNAEIVFEMKVNNFSIACELALCHMESNIKQT